MPYVVVKPSRCEQRVLASIGSNAKASESPMCIVMGMPEIKALLQLNFVEDGCGQRGSSFCFGFVRMQSRLNKGWLHRLRTVIHNKFV